tara:strand:- start:98 stop:487 length:390 start_codon:yes stop_codon:yes gene_type:complete
MIAGVRAKRQALQREYRFGFDEIIFNKFFSAPNRRSEENVKTVFDKSNNPRLERPKLSIKIGIEKRATGTAITAGAERIAEFRRLAGAVVMVKSVFVNIDIRSLHSLSSLSRLFAAVHIGSLECRKSMF